MTSNIISASSPRPLPPTNATFNFFSFFLFRQRHLQPSRAPLRDLHRAARCLCGLGFTKNRECLRSCSCSSVRLGWRCVEIGQTPPLPADKARAIGRLGVGHFTKVTLQFAAPFWNPESHTLRYVHFHTRVCLSPSALCISCRIVAWAVQRPRTRNNEHPPLVGPRPATDPPAPVCANDADAPVSFFLPPSRSFSRSLFSLPLPCASPSPGSTTPKKKKRSGLVSALSGSASTWTSSCPGLPRLSSSPRVRAGKRSSARAARPRSRRRWPCSTNVLARRWCPPTRTSVTDWSTDLYVT